MTTLDSKRLARRLPVGAEVCEGGGVHFRVWAPRRNTVQVVSQRGPIALQPEGNGYFSGLAANAETGDLYRLQLDDEGEFPDPASRFQPEGPHGPSQIVNPSAFVWSDSNWKGLRLEGQILYEIHLGTFTSEGTWAGAEKMLPYLAESGITVVEVMPVADFPGRFGWGYDGVNWFAPCRLYGGPDDMRRFVNRAHSLGIGVILDAVYNHLGPDGNYLGQYSRDYFSTKHKTDWGEAINYDGENSGPVREYVQANARYWIEEFHLDGLRLDATQNIYDDSRDHILAGITRAVREGAAGRDTIVVAENEPQEVKLVRPASTGGYGMDGLWNDDFHHSAAVALTGRKEAYYTDYYGTPQELLSAVKYGYLFQGQWYKWQKQRRGTPAFGVPRSAFVTFLENHDQVANSARGLRAHQLAAPGLYRALMAVTMLGPGTPMLFQGQEFASPAPFLFFTDMPEPLAKLVREGRTEFMEQWRSMQTPAMRAFLQDPGAQETFERCKLDHSGKEKNAEAYRFHCDLIRLKRTDPVLSALPASPLDGAVLSAEAFLVRFFGEDGDDRLLMVNLGRDLHLDSAPEPLLAPPEGRCWTVMFCTEGPQYGGSGAPEFDREQMTWLLPGRCTALFRPEAAPPASNEKKETSGA